MDISLNWLNNILSFQIPIKKTNQLEKLLTFYGFNPNYLTLNGFEVETIYNKNINNVLDIIIEIDTTPNRRDLNSIAGICNELMILLNLNAKQPSFYIKQKNFFNINRTISKSIKVETNIDPIFYIQAKNVTVVQSPPWLKNRLLTYNIETTNIFNDLTYYIQLEWGQTIQFYDLDKINDFNFKIKQKNKNSIFPTGNEQKIDVSKCKTLENSNQVLSLCGIDINSELRVTDETSRVLIECANYSRKDVKLNQNLTKLQTAISLFNEKGVTGYSMELALQRTLKLLSLYCDGIRYKKGPFYNIKSKDEKNVTINYAQIRQTLGQSKKNHALTNFEIETCAQRLKFPIKLMTENQIQFEIPKSRTFDIEEEVDLIEEIGRMYGFNSFKSQIPKLKTIGKITQEQKIINQFKTFAINYGFYELINYSFSTGKKENDKNYYQLLNPLSVGNILQQTLITNLIDTITFNLNQQNQLKRGFEISRIFHKITDQEITLFSGFITDELYQVKWGTNSEYYSWYQFKNLITNLFDYIGLKDIYWLQNENAITKQLHPSRGAILKHGTNTIGIVGQIHPLEAKNQNINPETFIFELNATLISQIATNMDTPIYQNFSLFPRIYRDISFTIPREDSKSKYDALIIKFINKSMDLVKDLYLKDNYEFETNGKEFRTLTYSFVFQSKSRTLKNSEIEKLMKDVQTEIDKIKV